MGVVCRASCCCYGNTHAFDASDILDFLKLTMSRELIGPALPPGFRVRDRDPDEANQVSGPALPPGFKPCHSSGASDDSEDDSSPLRAEGRQDSDGENGPCLKRRKQEIAKEDKDDEDDDGFFGPALPPGFKMQAGSPERVVIGPALPPGFIKQNQDSDGEDDGLSGTTSETEDSSEEESGSIGPTPAKSPVDHSVAEDFVRRAQKMKEKLTSGDDDGSKQVERESWMTELPPELANFGLGPRTFKRRTNEKSGDRSIWTDTPAEREKKAKEKQEGKTPTTKVEEEVPLSQRDKRLAEKVSSYNDSKRSESLMDIHNKKLKQKAKEEKNKPQERRPFDRDQDLQVNKFDDAQKKALVKKSRELNTRFSHGKSNMFL
ncbi:hypothetical protein NDU88_002821 [Pleurodeles waltl]|uniref:GPALPP motifs-containing protein 1 n=1 Tax=Pleurodeles waltl TaxID=8319 RepID=A0AAV7NF34_PLEWA|nr:hypothetical protein NDU88_002821 [Pleurodeles waltl]